MMPAFAPQPGSIGARAIAYLQSQCGSGEASSVEMALALGITVDAVGAYLAPTKRHGLIVRDKRGGKSYWRLGGAAPPPDPGKNTDSDDDSDDDAASIARDPPAFATGPLAGVVRQSWCPAAQETGSESSLDEPPPAPRPAAAPIGLGWKSPRVPVFLADAPTPAIAIEPGEDPELRALEDLHDQAVRRATAPAATADAVRALSAAIAPTPPDDPDFQEVRRDLGLVLSSVIPEHVQAVLGEVHPDHHPKGAEAACTPTAPCGRDVATPNNGGVSQGPDEGFRCALWSNGMLDMLTSEGERILLNADDTRGLVRYVSEVLSARVRAMA